MPPAHGAAADDAFQGALAAVAGLRRDEVAALREAQARLGRLVERGSAACRRGPAPAELRAWGEDAAAELVALGLGAEEDDAAAAPGPAAPSLSAAAAPPRPAPAKEAPAAAGPPPPEAAPDEQPAGGSRQPSLVVLGAAEPPLPGGVGPMCRPPDEAPSPGGLRGPAAPPDGGVAAADAALAPPGADGKVEDERQAVDRASEVQATTSSCSPQVPDAESSVWQWLHKSGYRCYDEDASRRIESAWRGGEPKVRLRSGKCGKRPMEVFFADMVQLDPLTGNSRSVRRVGRESLFRWTTRNFNMVRKKLSKGQMRWETSSEYRKRQINRKQSLEDAEQPALGYAMVRGSQMFKSSNLASRSLMNVRARRQHIGLWCGRLLQSLLWRFLTSLVTATNVLWIFWMSEHYPGKLSFGYPAGVFITETLFIAFFSVDLMVRLLAYKDATYALHSSWFREDAWVVLAKLFDVLLFPILYSLRSGSAQSDVDPDTLWFWLGLFVRLSTLLRVKRLFRIFPQASGLGNAIVSGLEHAAIIILMMVGAGFGFAVLLRTGVRHSDIVELYFPTMTDTFQTLLVQGLFFDGVLDYLVDCSDDFVSYYGMILWIFVGQYCFLNLLIGVFSSAIAEAAAEQARARETSYLERNLASILECYLDESPGAQPAIGTSGQLHLDGSSLDRNDFHLILENLDVLDVLKASGTDIEGLESMEHVLFPRDGSRLSIQDLYEVLLRLRKGKPASVTDVVNLRELVRRQHERLKELVKGALGHGAAQTYFLGASELLN